MLRRLRIQARLWLAFGIILAMTAALVLLGGLGLRVSQQAIQGITQKLIPASNITVAARSQLLQSRAATATQIDIIGEISAAAIEQRQGIGEVNGTVTELDQMTQQNAALVEQSAAAAQSLKEQAVRLAAIVSSFKLA
jgi:methyl-accepting chemotaxis protein